MRTFIAIPLPGAAQSMLGELQADLRVFGAAVRWTAIPSVHLTLKFLGEIDPASAPRLAGLLHEFSAAERPFTLRLRGLGTFPNLRNPRVIWCGIEGEREMLAALQAKVEAACMAAGFPPEERPFQPHLTLGRVHGKTNLQPLLDYIKIGSALEHSFTVTCFNVYQSTLRPQGALYTIMEKIELKGDFPR